MSVLNFFPAGTPSKRAVAYYRHSAEDKQENSVLIQRELTQRFAEKHGIAIMHEEADEGVTGLLADRPGFQRLFNEWVFNEKAPHFDYILVYDVSRWGRFQNQDEAAYHQYLCSQRGKEVIFVTHGLPRPEEKMNRRLQTAVEREMAAIYSQQLSDKVFFGSMKVAEQGYSAGGMACYGMARQLLDLNRNPVRLLKRGEHKQIANERVKFVPCGDQTTETVKEMFLLAGQDYDTKIIAGMLNAKGVPAACAGKWNSAKVRRVLKNEIYTGKRIYNKTWNRLRQGRRHNPRSAWVIREQDFPAVVSDKLFDRVQRKLAREEQKFISIRRILKTRFLEDLRQYLSGRGKSVKSLHAFPVTVSCSLVSPFERRWCFSLSRAFWKHSHVVCIGAARAEDVFADRCFLIPTNDFGCTGVRVLREGDADDQRYALPVETFAEKVVEIAENIFRPDTPSVGHSSSHAY